MGIGPLMTRMRNIKGNVHGAIDATFFEVSYELGEYVDAAAYGLRTSGELLVARSHSERTRLIYEAVRANRADGVDLTDDQDSIKALRALPPWKSVIGLKKYLPLVTQCAVSHSPMSALSFDHIIVDEAQDVRPLEWRLLTSCNRNNAWTVLGDMNQRRTDHAYGSWKALVTETGIISDLESFLPSTFIRGYRSTAKIMTFANRLLPRSERKMENIQEEGLSPIVLKSSDKNLNKKVVDAALELMSKYPKGTVAVIIPVVTKLKEYLFRDGWTQDAQDKRYWNKSGKTFSLITPEVARGLEFDGVVVVEPKDFPTNLARLGSLYTSLTRANKELTIVHSLGLPDQLR
jgi:superfamily I DNA/RNA helicase